MKYGFTLIELVVAIVVVGIALMSVPTMLQQSSEAVETNTLQEGIMAGITQLTTILTYRWDENETNETRNGSYAKVVDVTGIDRNQSFDRIFGTSRRIGHFIGEKRRRFYDQTVNASAIGLDDGETSAADADDIDDFSQKQTTLIPQNGANDYKLSYTLYTNVHYVKDDHLEEKSSDTTNIKEINLTVQNSINDTNITLRAFSCNIGDYKLLYKHFE